MKIVYQGGTDEDAIVEFEDAFEAVFEPQDAACRREAAMEARKQRTDPQ